MPHAGGASTLLCISLGRREVKLCKKHITGTSPGFASFTRLIGKKSLNNKVLELAIDESVKFSSNSNGPVFEIVVPQLPFGGWRIPSGDWGRPWGPGPGAAIDMKRATGYNHPVEGRSYNYQKMRPIWHKNLNVYQCSADMKKLYVAECLRNPMST